MFTCPDLTRRSSGNALLSSPCWATNQFLLAAKTAVAAIDPGPIDAQRSAVSINTILHGAETNRHHGAETNRHHGAETNRHHGAETNRHHHDAVQAGRFPFNGRRITTTRLYITCIIGALVIGFATGRRHSKFTHRGPQISAFEVVKRSLNVEFCKVVLNESQHFRGAGIPFPNNRVAVWL
jgi:hypothetical protein